MKKILLLFVNLILVLQYCNAQIKIESRKDLPIKYRNGFFINYPSTNVYHATAPSKEKLAQLCREDSLDLGSKTYRFATAVSIQADLTQSASWIVRGSMSYGRLLLVASGATSVSMNFGIFQVPELAEMVIYNSIGTFAGPITSRENNDGHHWATPVFNGDSIWIELKLPTAKRDDLKLKLSNLAYGYRQLDIGKSGGFGVSGACLANNNVVCFDNGGNGWQFERNAVCMLLDQNGERFCSGAMINNSCNNNIPYILSANHCLPGGAGSVSQWRFVFQYWSPTCNPSQDDPNYVQFYGSTLRANATPSDFVLLQLNQMPDPGSGITYLGWDRTVNAATSGASIHHPSGDVMKISTFNSVAQRIDNFVFANGKKAVGSQHWIVSWNNGITEGGSSGAPLLNQSKKIVGQLSGGSSTCNASSNYQKDGFGRFDNSWTGLGVNGTRLSNWLDPSNFGNTTTSSIQISQITGSSTVCTTAAYSVAYLQPGTSVVSWSSSNTSLLTINAGGTASRVGNGNGQVTLTATLNNGCGNFTRSKTVHVPIVSSINVDSDVCTGQGQDVVANLTGAANASWSVTSGNGFNATLTDNGNGIAYFNSNVPDCYGLQINVSNACGSVLDGTTICVNSCFGQMIAYPNPAKDLITLDFSNLSGHSLPDRIHVFTENSGNAARSIAVEAISLTDRKLHIDTHDWPRGTYYLHAVSNTGQQVEKVRVVLQ